MTIPANNIDSKSTTPVVIIEPNYMGHRMFYCRLIAQKISESSQTLVLATSTDAISSIEFRTHLAEFIDKVEILDLGPLIQPANIKYQRRVLRHISAIKKDYPRSSILILEGDKFVLPLALAGIKDVRDVTVLIMRAPSLRFRLNRSWIADLLKTCGMVLVRLRGARIKVLAPAMRAVPPYRFRGFSAVPDPVDLQASPTSIERYRLDLGLSPDRIWVGVFGNVSPRKNLDLVAQSLCQLESSNYGLLVAGKIDDQELSRCSASLEAFKRAGGALVFDSRLLTDQELDSAIASVSVAAIAHSSEGPSGILGKAAASGVPVAAAGALSLRDDIERLGAGAWSVLSADEFATALSGASKMKHDKMHELANGHDFAVALLPVGLGPV